MLESLLAPQFIALYCLVAAAVYVHYRGRVRHGFRRQLTDHSSLMAPYNALGKWIKRRSRLAHYTLKWLIISGLLFWVFA
jgi:aspartyl/asparaginyl beta-hydroxylase (cupin superfamily)